LLLAVGCGRNDINVYIVPKEQPSAPMPVEQTPTDAAPQLKWEAPAGWETLPPGNFRVASFKVTGPDGKQADVSVIPLPGDAGGDFSNVNRWRGQVGLAPIAEDELAKFTQAVEIAGQPSALYEQTGATNSILAAIQHRAGTTWFYKMTGDSQLVPQQKPVFIAFLKSIQFAAASEPTGSPQWNPPADWQAVPPGQFLVAKFTVADGAAAVNISSSPGDGGGVVANVNRWRKQLGLPPSEEVAAEMETTGGRASVVEMAGEKNALVGVIVRQADRAWFYKLMGDPAVVAAQKDAFLKFVREVKY
jgi:hypothetical protein